MITSTVTQDGQRVALATGLFGAAGSGPVHQESRPPDVPGPAECGEMALPAEAVPFLRHVRIRPATATRPFDGGDTAELVGWLQLADSDLGPAQVAVVLLDSLPPALWAVGTKAQAMPTMDLAVHLTDQVDRLEVSGWTLTLIRAERAGAGWSIEASALWRSDGALLATARQARPIL